MKAPENAWNMLKVNNKDDGTSSIELFGVFIVSAKQVSHIVFMFSLLSLNKLTAAGKYPSILHISR